MKKKGNNSFGLRKGSRMSELTYELLYSCSPFFESEILAGWDGKNNPFYHVYHNTLPKEKNSLVVLDYSEKEIIPLEKIIKNELTTGVLIVTKYAKNIPPALIHLANQYNKPLLVLKNYDLIEIIKRVTEIIFLCENKLDHIIINEISTFFLNIYFQDGFQQSLNRFQQMFGQEIYLLNYKLEYIPFPLNNFTEQNFNHIQFIEQDKNFQIAVVTNGNKKFYSFPVSYRNKHHAFHILFEKKNTMNKKQIQLLQAFIPTLKSWLKQEDITKKVHNIYMDQFLFDILHNNIESERELFELGKLHGLEITSNPFVLTININGEQIISKNMIADIKKILEKTNMLNANIYSTYLNYRIVSIVFPKHEGNTISKKDINQLIYKIQKEVHTRFPNIQLLFGVGNSYESVLNIHKSFQESKIALQMEMYGLGKNGIIHYEDTGFIRLLTYIHSDLLMEFANLYLGKLYDYDNENDTELIHTLSEYIHLNGDINRTAESLYIHQNTLRQRLKKIENVLNVDLHNYNDLVNLIISIKISQEMNL